MKQSMKEFAYTKGWAWLIYLLCLPFSAHAQAPHPERIYLSGTGLDHTSTWEFYCSSGAQSKRWKHIEVPCNWELQGFGSYTYGRWYKKKGAQPSKEVGTYRHQFKAEKSWQGQRVKIYFDGVMTDATVFINGIQAGPTHQGGFYRFSYDITGLLKWGKSNTLEVKVAKHSANPSINAAERKADWWLFGGIYRPVWLEVVPTTHIRHLVVSARHTGELETIVEMENPAPNYSITVSVRDLLTDKPLCTVQGLEQTQYSFQDTSVKQQFSTSWSNPKTWDTEHPHLYVAQFDLKNAEGQVVQSKQQRIGFRTIEFHPQDGLYLNGTRLVLKGVNRHSFSVDGGRTTSAAMSREDAMLVKQMNMNAVRSHYPPDEHFLDMCDSLGIVYMDELAGWQNGYDNEVGPRLVKEMMERDVNHPCIVIWSHGNEGGWNTRLDPLFTQYDPLQKRHMVHPWADFNDLDTHHYPAYLTGVGRFTNGYKVFMPTEFMHAMYDQGGGAGLRDFWDRWLTNPMFAGGFIWVFCDEAPRRTDRGGILDSDGSNAPDGIVGPRREKEGSFWSVRQQWSPIQVKPLLITPRFQGDIFLINEFTYTSLNECTMNYCVRKNTTPMEKADNKKSNTIIAQGEVVLPMASPGETGKAHINLPSNFHEGDVLELEAFDPQGRSLCTWSYPIRLARAYYEHHLSKTPATLELKSQPTAVVKNGVVSLKSENVQIDFDASSGLLTHVQSNSKLIPLKNGPVAVGMKMRYDSTQSYVRQEDTQVTYCAKYQGAVDSIVWRLTEDGLLYMDAILLNRSKGGGGFDDAFMDTEVKNLGLTFDYPEDDCLGMQWMGRGPYRVWKNRVAGTNYGIWQKDYNNTITGEDYENLIYPEFKGYHANMYWVTLQSKTKPFSIYSRTDGIYYRIFTPQEPKAAERRTMPEFPAGDLSFLLDIPAICSFKPIEQQGPNSQPGNIRIKGGDEGLHLNLTFDFR